MELKEVSASKVTPYRCYVKGKIIQTEGESVQTLGFKDGIPVLQVMTKDRKIMPDKVLDTQPIDLSKLQKIIVQSDPKTGKKYMVRDGKRTEILPQINPITINASDKLLKTIISTNAQTSSAVLIKRVPTPTEVPKLVPLSGKSPKMRVLKEGVKYQVFSMNKGKNTEHKDIQTDSLYVKEAATQTEDGLESDQFSLMNFILNSDEFLTPKKMIDTSQLKTREEIQKFKFFNDMRAALNFDMSGNLPIHDSVLQNDAKAVRKNAIVLRAVRESVDILNQHSYAPLHLAIMHNVDLEVIKALLQQGADVKTTDPDGNTAVHLAIEHRRLPVLSTLLTSCQTRDVLDTFNFEGFTPLILACLYNFYEAAEVLLKHGADPNVKDIKSGRTALFHAAENQDADLVELLMQNGSNTRLRNFFGTSPHDAMFELEDMPMKIKFAIWGRDQRRKLDSSPKGSQTKNKSPLEDLNTGIPVKKRKLHTTPILKKVTTSDLMPRKRKS